MYREFSPAPFLAGVVDCFWTSTVPATSSVPALHRVLPDGCMDLLFDFAHAGSRRATVVGSMTRPLTFTTTGAIELLGVRFRPGGLSQVIDVDASEVTDAIVDLANFWGSSARHAWEQLAGAMPRDRVGILHELLRARADGAIRPDPLLRQSVIEIERARGSLRTGDLERHLGVSSRQLERKFARHLGMSPKVLARIVRFQAVASAATRVAEPDWARLAADFGFADQPHLIREFKSFSGLTPTCYVREMSHAAQDAGFLQDEPERKG